MSTLLLLCLESIRTNQRGRSGDERTAIALGQNMYTCLVSITSQGCQIYCECEANESPRDVTTFYCISEYLGPFFARWNQVMLVVHEILV
jgi:hypothetical protein